MSKKIHLCIITPNRKFYDDEVDMVIVRGSEGDLAVLAGHLPYTTTLSFSIATIKNDDKTVYATIMGGFIEIHGDRATIVTDAAEWPEEIDTKRATSALERAKERLTAAPSGHNDTARADISLRRALVRIEASSYRLDDNNKPIKMQQV